MSYFLDAPGFAADVKSWAQGVRLTESCARFNRIYFENDGAVRAFYGRIVSEVRFINHSFTRGAQLNAVWKTLIRNLNFHDCPLKYQMLVLYFSSKANGICAKK